jgi:hypothetical protein
MRVGSSLDEKAHDPYSMMDWKSTSSVPRGTPLGCGDRYSFGDR